jgi:hypothetical protein
MGTPDVFSLVDAAAAGGGAGACVDVSDGAVVVGAGVECRVRDVERDVVVCVVIVTSGNVVDVVCVVVFVVSVASGIVIVAVVCVATVLVVVMLDAKAETRHVLSRHPSAVVVFHTIKKMLFPLPHRTWTQSVQCRLL